jgi:hypothetical protein
VKPLPAAGLRANLGTWAVSACHLPAVAHVLHDALPSEPWDPHFLGQRLRTTYFDTARFALRKARRGKEHYLTLRLRCYQSPDGGELYALSAKTEADKFRVEVSPAQADQMLEGSDGGAALAALLPANLLARLQDLAGDEPLGPIVTVSCRRYAVEDPEDRFTLDVEVHTDTGKRLGPAILEFKSTSSAAVPPAPLLAVGLRPIKLSKFLWATRV